MHVIDKIRKLLAMAEGNENEAEAALFAEKAAAMLAAHNLSMADVAEEEKGDISESEWHTMYLDPWRRRIIRSAAMLYFCDIFLRKWYDKEGHRMRDGVVIVGRPHNVFIAKEMADYLINTTMRLAISYSKETESQVRTQRGMRLAFERGCGERLAVRLNEMRLAKSHGEIIYRNGNPGNLPALYTTESLLTKQYLEALRLGVARVRGSDLSTLHSRAGMRAANQISLSPQLGGGKRHLLT